jgi:hypothetical protein
MLNKYISKLIVCLLIFQNCLAQQNADSGLNNLVKKVVENIITSDKQKALLVTDRKIYTAGETVCFKAFVVDSIHSYLQTSPQKLYVDWVDKRDRVINRLILNNGNFQTSGRFVLQDSLNEGFYWLRAYNKKILDEDINNIAVVPIYVLNADGTSRHTSVQTSDMNNTNKTMIKFYPEGGSIMSGLNSTVALSATDENGTPKIISGIVKDNHDSIAATFTTNKYGLAKFSYSPDWFKKYVVFIKNGNEYDSIADLPRINFFAAQLAITQQNNDYITARVALEDSIYSKNYTTYLIALSGDSLCFTSVGRGMYNVTIPVAKFPSGIAALYLFNDKGEFLSSRNVYINKENYHLTVKADKKNYAARDEIKLNFKITDAHNQPEVASFSLSVADKNVIDTNLNFFQTDTLRNLSQQDADLIMLTQNQKINPLYTNETQINNNDNDSGFTLSGTIVTVRDEPVANCVITILSNEAIPIVETDTSDVNGKFKFNLPAYTDNTKFTFQLNDIKGKNTSAYHINFDVDSKERFKTPAYLKTTFPLSASLSSIKNQLMMSDSAFSVSGKHWLNPVTVKTRNKSVDYDTTKKISRFSHIITREMIGNGPGMAGAALLNVPGIRLMNGYVIVGTPNGFSDVSAKDEPLVVLDGVEMSVAQGYTDNSKGGPVLNFLNSLPVRNIDFIEVITGPAAAAYGMEGAKGVIVVNTTSKDESTLSTATGLKSFYAKGFYNDKPFEVPDYSKKEILKSKSPDLRKTIYWNGNIVSDKNGEASVEFFSADEATTYIGVIRGITVNGDKIYQTFTISRN